LQFIKLAVFHLAVYQKAVYQFSSLSFAVYQIGVLYFSSLEDTAIVVFVVEKFGYFEVTYAF
jgi:hypothetical protein